RPPTPTLFPYTTLFRSADELRIDLDPQPGIGFDEVRAGARVVKALLDEVGIAGWPKTTGNRGIHVYIRLLPRWDPFEVRAAAVRSEEHTSELQSLAYLV